MSTPQQPDKADAVALDPLLFRPFLAHLNEACTAYQEAIDAEIAPLEAHFLDSQLESLKDGLVKSTSDLDSLFQLSEDIEHRADALHVNLVHDLQLLSKQANALLPT